MGKTPGFHRMGVLCAVSVLVIGVPTAAATSFIYQGRLDDGGSPANGTYDLRFRLYDMAQGGAPLGSPVVINDESIQAGLFSVEVDFGVGMFTGDPRWLEIEVRDGASVGSFTPLSPRQPVTPAPYALYALDGGADPLWAVAGAGITNSSGDFVGVNRSSQVTSAEYFGIQAPVASGYGGMYIRTDGAEALPFYGYSTGTETAWTYLDGATDKWHLYNDGVRVTVTNTGYVGVGETSPTARLQVQHTSSNDDAAFFHITSASNNQAAVHALTEGTGTAGEFIFDNTGDAGTGVLAVSNGTSGSAAVSGLSSGAAHAVTGASLGTGRAGLFQVLNASNTANALEVRTNGTDVSQAVYALHTGRGDCAVFEITNSDSAGEAVEARTNGSGEAILAVNTGTGLALRCQGTARVDVLEIEGADVAEKFPVSEAVEPGMVVAIDPRNAGKLCLARGAYNPCVAGIVSGANGLKAGTVLGHLPGHEDAPPIALTGRVWCWADASNGAIVPGDRLTTSDTPGHAMKVTDGARAGGATLGKAMTPLAEGRGLVLVLVNLH